MKLYNFLLSAFLFTLPLTCKAETVTAAVGQSVATPLSLVRQTVEELVTIVEANPGADKQAFRREKMRVVIEPRFDFAEMSKRSLGAYWKDANEAEQKEFVALFSDMLARTYLSKIDTVKRDMVNVKSEEVDGIKATVKSIVTVNDDDFPLDYRLINQNGNWRVYDVIIENIGVVSNYRNEFSGIIRKEKFSGLLAKLREKK